MAAVRKKRATIFLYPVENERFSNLLQREHNVNMYIFEN